MNVASVYGLGKYCDFRIFQCKIWKHWPFPKSPLLSVMHHTEHKKVSIQKLVYTIIVFS